MLNTISEEVTTAVNYSITIDTTMEFQHLISVLGLRCARNVIK